MGVIAPSFVSKFLKIALKQWRLFLNFKNNAMEQSSLITPHPKIMLLLIDYILWKFSKYFLSVLCNKITLKSHYLIMFKSFLRAAAWFLRVNIKTILITKYRKFSMFIKINKSYFIKNINTNKVLQRYVALLVIDPDGMHKN